MTSKKRNSSTMIRTLSLLLVLAAAPAFAYTPPSQQQIDASSESFQLRDGVVADPARSAIYVMTELGVEAIDIERGEILWRHDAAARPVGLYGDQLVVLVTPDGPAQLALALLDVGTGEKLAAISGALPEGVLATVEDGPGRSFQGGQNVAGGAFFRWVYRSRPLIGAPVVAGEIGAAEQTSEGAFRLDPVNGLALAVEPDDAPTSAPFRFDLAAGDRLTGVEGRQFRDRGDRHVLASRKIDGSDGFNRYRWTLHDRSAVTLGSVDRPVSTAMFFVAGTTLVHEAGPVLRRLDTGDFEARGPHLVAADLRTGRELWSVDLRDTTYRGVMPP
ncbi:MAG: hypothetical protein AAGF23_18780 [Acidobacteriota bacterium]